MRRTYCSLYGVYQVNKHDFYTIGSEANRDGLGISIQLERCRSLEVHELTRASGRDVLRPVFSDVRFRPKRGQIRRMHRAFGMWSPGSFGQYRMAQLEHSVNPNSMPLCVLGPRSSSFRRPGR